MSALEHSAAAATTAASETAIAAAVAAERATNCYHVCDFISDANSL